MTLRGGPSLAARWLRGTRIPAPQRLPPNTAGRVGLHPGRGFLILFRFSARKSGARQDWLHTPTTNIFLREHLLPWPMSWLRIWVGSWPSNPIAGKKWRRIERRFCSCAPLGCAAYCYCADCLSQATDQTTSGYVILAAHFQVERPSARAPRCRRPDEKHRSLTSVGYARHRRGASGAIGRGQTISTRTPPSPPDRFHAAASIVRERRTAC
jgi:hypothetical protein